MKNSVELLLPTRAALSKRVRVCILASIFLLSVSLPLTSHTVAGDMNSQGQFPKIMTYNIYQGTELLDVVTATSQLQIVVGTAIDYGHQLANNFPERAQAIAGEVKSTMPDLIGLQEVALWRTGPDTNPPTPATTVTFDYLQILLNALSAQGLQYSALVVRNNFDIQGPACTTLPACFPLVDLRLTDRSAILVRTSDLNIPGLSFNNFQSQDYTTNTVLQVLGNPIVLLGGWESVDVSFHGFAVARFISTHMDGFSQTVRNAQAQQLVSGPINTNIPEVIMSGDLNSPPGSPSYNILAQAGLRDSWGLTNPLNPGFTCCQVNQNGVIVDVINNPTSVLNARVDVVLIRGFATAINAVLVGADPSSRTSSGLWPSDHAGLVVTLGPPQENN